MVTDRAQVIKGKFCMEHQDMWCPGFPEAGLSPHWLHMIKTARSGHRQLCGWMSSDQEILLGEAWPIKPHFVNNIIACNHRVLKLLLLLIYSSPFQPLHKTWRKSEHWRHEKSQEAECCYGLKTLSPLWLVLSVEVWPLGKSVERCLGL